MIFLFLFLIETICCDPSPEPSRRDLYGGQQNGSKQNNLESKLLVVLPDKSDET